MAHVVVGVDGSPSAAGALRWAVQEGWLRGWPVVVVLAWDYLDQHHATGAGFDPSYDATDAATALDVAIEGALGGAGGSDVERRPCDEGPPQGS